MGERVRRCLDCDGLLYWVARAAKGAPPRKCALCRREHRRQYDLRYYAENRERELESKRRVREAKRAEREAERARIEAEELRWREENPESWKRLQAQQQQERARRESERNRRWREANAERRREYERQWLRDNPDKRREQNRRRRALKRNAYTEHFAESDIYERDNGRCQLKIRCTGRKTLKPPGSGQSHIDHIIPLSLGGTHTPANVHLSCPACNLSKGNRAVGEQLRILG